MYFLKGYYFKKANYLDYLSKSLKAPQAEIIPLTLIAVLLNELSLFVLEPLAQQKTHQNTTTPTLFLIGKWAALFVLHLIVSLDVFTLEQDFSTFLKILFSSFCKYHILQYMFCEGGYCVRIWVTHYTRECQPSFRCCPLKEGSDPMRDLQVNLVWDFMVR